MSDFDRQDQYDKVRSGLLPGERLEFVYDCIGVGTGFVGVTDRRVVLQDNSFIGKQQAITSIPFSRVSSVSAISDKSRLMSFRSTSSIAIHVGSQTYSADFRGEDKAQRVHDYILSKIL